MTIEQHLKLRHPKLDVRLVNAIISKRRQTEILHLQQKQQQLSKPQLQ